MSVELDFFEAQRARVDELAKRVSFQLTYARAASVREFSDDGITNDAIDDAFGSGRSPGDWSSGGALCRFTEDDPEASDEDILRQFFTDAVSEAVHEALEWFRLDGKCALDPHASPVEQKIYDRCKKFAADLWALRGEQS